MEISDDGKFSMIIKSEDLVKGLRATNKSIRNSKFLEECSGVIGKDGILQSLWGISKLDLSISDSELNISGTFPFPQIFVLTNLIIVCNETKIYEKNGSTFDEKITVSSGSMWTVLDFYDYIYLSNGNVSVVRDPVSKAYAITTEVPTSMAACNFNGQVILGAPDVHI